MMRIFLPFLRNNGITKGIVFPAPVPAITTESSPSISASATSICQVYEFLPKRDKNSDWMIFRVLSELYPFF